VVLKIFIIKSEKEIPFDYDKFQICNEIHINIGKVGQYFRLLRL